MIQTGTLIHPSQPSLKWSAQPLIIGLQGSQQDKHSKGLWLDAAAPKHTDHCT